MPPPASGRPATYARLFSSSRNWRLRGMGKRGATWACSRGRATGGAGEGIIPYGRCSEHSSRFAARRVVAFGMSLGCERVQRHYFRRPARSETASFSCRRKLRRPPLVGGVPTQALPAPLSMTRRGCLPVPRCTGRSFRSRPTASHGRCYGARRAFRGGLVLNLGRVPRRRKKPAGRSG